MLGFETSDEDDEGSIKGDSQEDHVVLFKGNASHVPSACCKRGRGGEHSSRETKKWCRAKHRWLVCFYRDSSFIDARVLLNRLQVSDGCCHHHWPTHLTGYARPSQGMGILTREFGLNAANRNFADGVQLCESGDAAFFRQVMCG